MSAKVAIAGFGTVGQEVARVLLNKSKNLKNILGLDFSVVFVSDSSGSVVKNDGINLKRILKCKKEKGSVTEVEKQTSKLKTYEDSSVPSIDYDVLIECTPTNIKDGEPGMSNMLNALKQGKDVVTSNKGPLVLDWMSLKNAAKSNNAKLKFEAAVGGAMPVINLANDALIGNEIKSVRGIFNGTCNYILSRMTAESLSYGQVLSEAQDLGIAETDPTYDVEGIDTALKVAIIANAVMGMDASYDDVKTEGIVGITPEALKLAKEDNKVVKLIGEVENGNLEVAPKLVPAEHPLAVGGTLNVASIKTDLAGEITVTGRGAGAKETASSILSDLISISKMRKN